MKKSLLLLISVLLCVTTLPCVGTVQAQVKITWAAWGTPDEVSFWQEQVKLFEDKNPEVKVELVMAPWGEYHTKLLTMIAGGTAPDVMLVDGYYFPKFATRGVLLDLEQFIRDDNYSLDRFWPASLLDCIWEGLVYGLPWGFGPNVMVYNKELFEKHGVEDAYTQYTKGGWTWDDFLTAAQKMTIKEEDRITQFGTSSWMSHPWISPWLWSNGGGILSEDKSKIIVDTPETIEAVQFQYDLMFKHHVAPQPGEGLTGMFETGKMAIASGWPTNVGIYSRSTDFAFDLVPYPEGKAGRFNILKSNANAIYKGTKHPQEAWEFVKEIASPEAELLLYRIGQFWWPANKSVATSEEILNALPGVHIDVMVDCSEKFGRLLPIVVEYEEMEHIINEELESVVLGKKSAEVACKAIAERIRPLVE